jgi:TRAP-type mannitol/chloroaromatic compound transport system permease large subunit
MATEVVVVETLVTMEDAVVVETLVIVTVPSLPRELWYTYAETQIAITTTTATTATELEIPPLCILMSVMHPIT